MADEASTQEDTEPGFWARRIDKAYWPRRWWWPQPVSIPVDIDEKVNSVRRHDEASKTIRRVMMTLIAYGFFCLFTLSQPDSVLIEGKFKLPFANINIAFTDFLVVGPLILLGFALYLHIYIGYWHRIPLADEGKALPFIFNMDAWMPRFLTGFLFYWLVPVVLWVFTYKAAPHGVLAPLLLLTVATASVLLFLQIKRTSPERRDTWGHRCVWAVFAPAAAFSLYLGGQQAADLTVATYRSAMGLVQPVLAAGLPARQTPAAANGGAPEISPAPKPAPSRVARGRAPSSLPPSTVQQRVPIAQSAARTAQRALGLTRGLDLAGADLRKVDLSKRDLRGANLRGADLSGVNLSRRNLAGADLQRANLGGANLARANLFGANLRVANLQEADLGGAYIVSVVNLTCSQLRSARNWENAYRDKSLACGKPIPKPPAKAR